MSVSIATKQCREQVEVEFIPKSSSARCNKVTPEFKVYSSSLCSSSSLFWLLIRGTKDADTWGHSDAFEEVDCRSGGSECIEEHEGWYLSLAL